MYNILLEKVEAKVTKPKMLQILLSIFIVPSYDNAAVRFVEDGVRSPWEGEIEVYYGGQWDRVCNIDWDVADAEVVCQELGFDGAISSIYSKATHEVFDTAILDGALCTGEELHLLDCPRFVPLSNVTNDCLGNYAGVTCMNECPLISTPQYGRIITITGNTINSNVSFECFENFILMGSAIRRCQPNGQWSGNITKCVGVHLAGDLNNAQGRVEVYYEGEWGTVCDEGWDINDGTVVCHQLGYQRALGITTGASNFGPGNGPIHFQDVACQGSESNLFMCSFSRNITSCSHNQDVGVICADCPVIPPPEYGSISPVLSNPLSGNDVNFACNDGYNLLGSAEHTCMPSGEWSGNVVSCQATCKIEDATKNEKVRVEPASSEYVQDDQIIIVCDSGHHMANSSDPIIVRVCLRDRTWSGIDPHCEEIPTVTTVDNQKQTADNESSSSSNSTVVIVLAVVLGLTLLAIFIVVVAFFVKKRSMGVKNSGMKTSDDDKQMIVNPIYGTDEANETN